jgi:hypothetical protein
MKLLAILALAAMPFAEEAQLPDCWTVDGSSIGINREGREIADGQFLVTVNVSEVTKEDLVRVMGLVNRGNLRPLNYPFVFDGIIIFSTEAVWNGTEDPERLDLIEAVNRQMSEIREVPGVTGVECNGIARPHDPTEGK